jgi:hypothetical protein
VHSTFSKPSLCPCIAVLCQHQGCHGICQFVAVTVLPNRCLESCSAQSTPGLREGRTCLALSARPTPLPPAHPKTLMLVCACLDISRAPVAVCSVCLGRCAQVAPLLEEASLRVHRELPHHQALTALLIVCVRLGMVS